jgi:2-furoate---CoA ligase
MYPLIMDLARMLTWSADRYPGRRAVGGPQPVTYRQWDARTNQLARALAGLGVAPGDRVAFLLPGGEPMASLHLAAQKLGAASVPLSIRFSPAELAYCVQDAEPAVVIGDDTTAVPLAQALDRAPVTLAALYERAQREPDAELETSTGAEDLSVILYTSGTTGRPKGVPRTHRAEHAAAVAHVIQTQQRPGEVSLGVMPLFHTMGVRTLLASVLVGGTWVPQTRFDAEESLELIKDNGISSLYLVPTIYWSLLRTGRLADAAPAVTRIAYAGAPMTPALVEELTGTLAPEVFVNHFGSTEIYTFTVGAAAKPGCAGRAGVFSRVRLVDPLDPSTTVPKGTQGQVAVSMASPEAFAGYRHRPDADARAIRDGWYLTGDLAAEDEDGDLWVSGRVDDMINSGGENLYPDEIEGVLARCPAVSAVVVVGLSDDHWGQAVTAFLVPAKDFSAERAVAHLSAYARESSGLSSLKLPKRYVAVAAIPTSAVGKVLRRELTEGRYQPLAEAPQRPAGDTS